MTTGVRVCGLLVALGFMAFPATTVQAADVTGDWILNFPVDDAEWSLLQVEGVVTGEATVEQGRFDQECTLDGEVFFDVLYVANVECVLQPAGVTTTGIALFVVTEGGEISGVVVTTLAGVPIGFTELVGTPVQPPALQ